MINDAKLQKVIGWYPHNGGQNTVLQCKNREVAICAGRGWGKSMLMGYIVTKEFLSGLQRYKEGKTDSVKIFIVAPTYQLGEKVFENVVRFLLAFDRKAFQGLISSRPQPNIKLSESVWIQCKSATEPMGMLGERVDICVVDEAPLLPEKVYLQYLKPITASASKKGRSYYIGTPRGRGWFKKKFIMLKEKNAAFQYKSTDGVETTEEELEEIRKEYPQLLFEQEFMAKFHDDAGMVFKAEMLKETSLPKAQLYQDAIRGHHYVMGVDIAKEEDYTVITIIDITTNRVVHKDRFKGWDYHYQKEHIIAKARRYNNARIIIDATGVGKAIFDDLRHAGVFVDDFTFTGKSKEEMFGKLRIALENKYITIPNDDEELWDELVSFEYMLTNEKTGEPLRNIRYGHPPGLHDDCVDSLALANWGLNPGKPIVRSPMQEELKKMNKPKKPESFI